MPLCEIPFPTDGGPANPNNFGYFKNYWSVFLENEYFQMQRHKAEMLGPLGDWAMRKMRSRLRGDENTDGFRIIVKVGYPWPAVATASSRYLIERDWQWLESLKGDLQHSLPKQISNSRETVDAILAFLKLHWEDRLSSESDEDHSESCDTPKGKKQRAWQLEDIDSKPSGGFFSYEFDPAAGIGFSRSVGDESSTSSTVTVRSTTFPTTMSSPTTSSSSIPITPRQATPLEAVRSLSTPNKPLSAISPSSSPTGMPVLSGIAVSSARTPWSSGNTPPSNSSSPLSTSPSSLILAQSPLGTGTSPLSSASTSSTPTSSSFASPLSSLSRVQSGNSLVDDRNEGTDLSAAAMDLEFDDPLFHSQEALPRSDSFQFPLDSLDDFAPIGSASSSASSFSSYATSSFSSASSVRSMTASSPSRGTPSTSTTSSSSRLSSSSRHPVDDEKGERRVIHFL